VGREREVASIAMALRRHRLVTLTGCGGVGKTRVAVEVGANLQEGYEAVWFVDFAPSTESYLVPVAIASTMGIVLPLEDAASALSSALRAKRLLLILDNCEHLLDSVALVVAALFFECPGVSILTTSRRRLGIAGEVSHRMPSLALPSEADAGGLTAEGARRLGATALFVERAETASTGFALTDANAPVVAEVCRRLGGIALAIELAASRVQVLSLPDLRQSLDERFTMVADGPRGVSPRQRTLRATFDWSYDLLEERERAFLRGLGIFVGGFTLEAARAVCGSGELDEVEALNLLGALVDRSLVVADLAAQKIRYRLLETTRAYAFEKLSEALERETLAGLHLAYFRELAERGAPALTLELENVRAALRWSLNGGDVHAGALLASAIGWQWADVGLSADGIARVQALLAALADDTGGTTPARLWTALAWLCGDTFGHARAFEAAGRAVECARASGDPATLEVALRTRANFAAHVARFEEAEAVLTEAEKLA
jgi:predicted ATPase